MWLWAPYSDPKGAVVRWGQFVLGQIWGRALGEILPEVHREVVESHPRKD